LRNGKKIIAVANDTLAGNHQVELINKLAKENYLLGFESVDQLKKNANRVK
jgi:UDP-N-acetylglucosamine transferase subunit ALG13